MDVDRIPGVYHKKSMESLTNVSQAVQMNKLIDEALRLAVQLGRSEDAEILKGTLAHAALPGSPLELDLLAMELKRNGRLIRLSPGELGLLVVLACRGRKSTREELVEELYPHLIDGACQQLKVYVHRVRRRLDLPGVITSTESGYSLGPAIDVDLWRVEAEVRDAMRSKGALSAEAHARLLEFRVRLLRRDEGFLRKVPWGARLERRLEALFSDVTVRIAETALAERDISFAIGLAADLHRYDPCDERAAELAIRAHLAEHDRRAASRAYTRYARAIRDEFDSEPSEDLRRLFTEFSKTVSGPGSGM